MDDSGQRSRDTADQFGKDVERVFGDIGDTVDGLREGPREPSPAPDDRRSDEGGDITININR